MKRITILIVETQKLVSGAWIFIFNGNPDVHTLSGCESVEVAIKTVKQFRSDIVIIDSTLSGINGADAVSRIEKLSPGSRVRTSNGNKMYHYLFEQSANALIVDFNGGLQDVNPGLSSMLGYTKEELLHSNAQLTTDLNENTRKVNRFDCNVESMLTIDEDLTLNIYRIVQDRLIISSNILLPQQPLYQSVKIER